MASEAISSSILLIGAVVGAAFLITAILPVIFSAGDTFGTVSSTAENKMKTDFRIVNTYAHVSTNIDYIQVWMKNVGANQISLYDIQKSDVFFGTSSSIIHYTNLSSTSRFEYYDSITGDNYWNVGDTLEIKITGLSYSSSSVLSYTFSLPNSVRRSISFSANV